MIRLEKSEANALQNIKFIDLFAGIGGFHLALSSFGAQCVFASEIDNHAASVYYNNFNLQPVGDITKISSEEIPAHDILCAGFPCQSFSISGKQRGFEDLRGTLFFEIVRIAKQHKPQILILENVKNLERHDNGNTYKTITVSLQNLGYNVFSQVLNASDYGLPQNRERIFFVAFRKDLNITNFAFPVGSQDLVCLNDILEIKPKAKIIIRDDIEMSDKQIEEYDIFGSQIKYQKPLQIGIVNKGGQGERIYHRLGHSITLSAQGGGVGSKTGLYQIDGKIRKLSVRECARLQGFPEDFKLTSSECQSQKQFGNSVPVNVLQYIIKQIIERWSNE